ncbi:MAG: hypothetical protein KAU26_06130 [Methylococcales bacterium]|nr:hypothetical protein [Methylococcales bacterium]
MERHPILSVFEYSITTDHCLMENYQKLHESLLIMLKDLDNQLTDIIQKPIIIENQNQNQTRHENKKPPLKKNITD